MQTYRIKFDVSTVVSRLKGVDLGSFSSISPEVTVKAKDPDGACHKALTMFFDQIKKRDSSTKTKMILLELKDDIRVMTAVQINEPKL